MVKNIPELQMRSASEASSHKRVSLLVNHKFKCFLFIVLDICSNSHKCLQMPKTGFRPQELQGIYFSPTNPKIYAISYLA